MTVLLTYGFATSIGNRALGIMAALILVSTPHFIKFSKMGMLDAPLTLGITATLLCWWRAQRDPRWLIGAGAAVGATIMTKGAAGLLALPIIGVHALACGRMGLLLNRFSAAGALLATLISAPWHIHQLLVHGDAFSREYFGYHVIARSLAVIEGHSGGWTYYFQALFENQRPWFLLAPFALAYCAWMGWRSRSDSYKLLVVWVVVLFGIITAMRSKLDTYVIPAYPALSVCIALLIAARFGTGRRVLFGSVGVALVVLATTKRVWDLDYNPEVRELAAEAQRVVPEGAPIVAYRKSAPAVRFYGARSIVAAQTPQALASLVETQAGECYAIGRRKDFAEFRDVRVVEIERRDDVLLVALGALRDRADVR